MGAVNGSHDMHIGKLLAVEDDMRERCLRDMASMTSQVMVTHTPLLRTGGRAVLGGDMGMGGDRSDMLTRPSPKTDVEGIRLHLCIPMWEVCFIVSFPFLPAGA